MHNFALFSFILDFSILTKNFNQRRFLPFLRGKGQAMLDESFALPPLPLWTTLLIVPFHFIN
jgi:hypothetical protein